MNSQNQTNKGTLIHHHVKYKEIHGIDEVIMMTVSDHRKLHHRLRKSGKCTIPPDELSKISIAAHDRSIEAKESRALYAKTPEAKRLQATYQKTPKVKLLIKQYRTTDRFKENRTEWYKNNIQYISDYTGLGCGIQLAEKIKINTKTGSLCYSARFHTNNNNKLICIDI